MKNPPIIPLEAEVLPDAKVELDISSFENIETWYRSLRPDIDIRSVPREQHVDALASSILHLTGQQIPDSLNDRLRTALAPTSYVEKFGRDVALAGPKALLVSDLLLELVERGDAVSDSLNLQMLAASKQIALGVREDPRSDTSTKIKANARATNAAMAELEMTAKDMDAAEFSDKYIKTVRAEARWLSQHTAGAKTGDLFESFIGCLAKYQVWVAEEDGHQTARHATAREDQPAPRRQGGSGHEAAHDVTVRSRAAKAYLQCKWGPGAPEQADRYDPRKVTFVEETTDDGTLENNRRFAEALQAIASSSQPAAMETCERFVRRYGLDAVVDSISQATPRTLGRSAIVAAG